MSETGTANPAAAAAATPAPVTTWGSALDERLRLDPDTTPPIERALLCTRGALEACHRALAELHGEAIAELETALGPALRSGGEGAGMTGDVAQDFDTGGVPLAEFIASELYRSAVVLEHRIGEATGRLRNITLRSGL